MEKSLATWQLHYLSIGGKLTLTNSFVDNIPTYYMSIFFAKLGLEEKRQIKKEDS